MLRCTVAGAIPLMMSERYAGRADEIFSHSREKFEEAIEGGGYYILRDLPERIARELLMPVLPALLQKQQQNGLWRGKDPERVAFDIFSALQHIGLLNELLREGKLASPLDNLKGRHSYHAVMIRRILPGEADAKDGEAAGKMIMELQENQREDGSWGGTCVGTVFHIGRLLSLRMPRTDPSLVKGAGFLLGAYRETLPALQGRTPYGLEAHGVFTTSRDGEFEAAEEYCSEWDNRKLCFHHMAVLQDSVSLKVLIEAGYERDERTQVTLENLARLYARFGGLCASNIKKPYLTERK